jgi:hypothetical protein
MERLCGIPWTFNSFFDRFFSRHLRKIYTDSADFSGFGRIVGTDAQASAPPPGISSFSLLPTKKIVGWWRDAYFDAKTNDPPDLFQSAESV